MKRKTEAKVDELFVNRWSPRSLSSKEISEETLMSLFEAARWAPSSRNEQPWLFVYATGEEKKILEELLIDTNRAWASKAPVLVFVFGKRRYDYKNYENRVFEFDSGAAWMSLALQARMHGLHTHAMGGIKHEEVYSKLNISKKDYKIFCAIAIGYGDDPSNLPEGVEEREQSDRKPLSEVAIKFSK